MSADEVLRVWGVGVVKVPHVPHGPAYGLPKPGGVSLLTRALAVDVEVNCNGV